MRTLLLMRGAMGSGKSTWIKDNLLEPYTLSADDFRLKVCNPVLTENGFTISQRKDSIAWNMLLSCLEHRMSAGHFTVIDATHNNRKLVKHYEKLGEKYKYQIFVKTMDTPLEECLRRNAFRDVYKYVPEESIRRAHAIIENVPLPNRYKPINELSEIDNFFTDDLNAKDFDQVQVIGDVHACLDALQAMTGHIHEQPNTLFVFTGDYLERGTRNYDTLQYMMKLADYRNVILLEGNHEIHLRDFAMDEECKSRYFAGVTRPELLQGLRDSLDEDDDDSFNHALEDFKKEIRLFYKKLRQAYCFKFGEQKYLVCHGGLTHVPKLTYVSAKELIYGVGDYETPVGEIYKDNYLAGKCQDFIQIHGHRYCKSSEYSYCLEGNVEGGGELKSVIITKDKIIPYNVTNTVVRPKMRNTEVREHDVEDIAVDNVEVSKFINNPSIRKYLKIRSVDPNLYSINFRECVFKRRLWNEYTIKARGLFVDRVTGDVMLRSYNKMFNLNELKGVSDTRTLKQTLQFPVKVWRKENGFLGILSVIDDEFVFATKSLTDSEFVDYFKREFFKLPTTVQHYFYEKAKTNNLSFMFEVMVNEDKHIVDYGDVEWLCLLDAVENKLHIDGHNIDPKVTEEVRQELSALPECPNNLLKTLEGSFEDWESLMRFLTRENETSINQEGFVLEDRVGHLVKYKLKWYNDWKRRRGLMYTLISRPNEKFNYQKCRDETDVKFIKYLETKRDAGEILNNELCYNRWRFIEDTREA